VRLSLNTKQRTLIHAQNRPTRNGNNQTKKINPTKLQTHLNTPEPHGQYLKPRQQKTVVIFWPHHAYYYLVGKGKGKGEGEGEGEGEGHG
jgi:hypothetical protein